MAAGTMTRLALRKPGPCLRVLVQSARQTRSSGVPKDLRGFFVRFARTHGRRFPWRSSKASAYEILLAEVLLRQTRAEDALGVWEELARSYPDFAALERASASHVRRLLKPIGLQSQRQGALGDIARAVNAHFRGRLPSTAQELLSIPHIGLYATCALLCFRFGKIVPIVDANVLRVLGRITGREFGKDPRRNPDVWAVAWQLLSRKHPAAHNYGLLDFGALVCLPRRPRCHVCPIRQLCKYEGARAVGLRPDSRLHAGLGRNQLTGDIRKRPEAAPRKGKTRCKTNRPAN
jgi:A/G-specific adenine glycosylase